MSGTEEMRKAVAEWIRNEFGKRCPVYSAGCPTCEMWAAFDRLFMVADTMGEYSWQYKIRDTSEDEHHSDTNGRGRRQGEHG